MKQFLLMATFAVVLGLFAGSADAGNGVPIPGVQTAHASATMTALAVKHVNVRNQLVVFDEHIKVQKHEASCQRFSTFQNSSNVLGSYNGSRRVTYIDHNGYLCRDKNSPTGWVKRGGGKTGRDCKNIAAPMNVKMPYPIFRGVILSYSTRNSAMIMVQAKASIHTVLDLWCGHLENNSVATDTIRISYGTFVKLKGNARMNYYARFFANAVDKVAEKASLTCSYTPPGTPPPPPPPAPPTPPSAPSYNCTGLSLSTSNLTATAAISIVTSGGAQFKNATVSWGDTQSTTGGLTQTHTYGSAGTYGVHAVVNFTLPNGSSASANCSGSVSVSSPPVQHWVQVSCTGFEELFGGESMIIKCDVSTDDQNAMISLDAHSNDANSRVSGINCYSQGGSPSCKGNGQFEFRVSGINDGTSTLSSSVTVTASASGVSSKPWTSDPFPIDPSGGGF